MTQTNYASFLKTFETTSPGVELYSSTDTVTKDKVVSVRMEQGLYSMLEALAEAWNTGSTANTVRTILSMYFLPVVFEYEWKNLTPEKVAEFKKQEQEQGFSQNLARLHKYLSELVEYRSFLVEAQTKGSASMEFIQQKLNQVESMVEQLAEAELKAGELLE
jgi:uncharacterized protein YutD